MPVIDIIIGPAIQMAEAASLGSEQLGYSAGHGDFTLTGGTRNVGIGLSPTDAKLVSVSVNVNAAGTKMLSIHVQCDSSNRFQKSSHEPAATCTTLRLSDGLSILRRTSSSQIAITVLT